MIDLIIKIDDRPFESNRYYSYTISYYIINILSGSCSYANIFLMIVISSYLIYNAIILTWHYVSILILLSYFYNYYFPLKHYYPKPKILIQIQKYLFSLLTKDLVVPS